MIKSSNKTIKFFISSTFKDFLKERNALQNFVFPKLKKLCDRKGFYFQPVDLRWGVTSEQSEDNQTMQYCINEVSRCSTEPKPNLLILLGQRYGWGPLPSELTITEWNLISEKVDTTSLKQWYIQDLNDVDKKYYLKDKKDISEKQWREIEKELKFILQNVDYDKENEITKNFERFHTSATEQEIRYALENQYKSDSNNTIVYARQFTDDKKSDLIEQNEKAQEKLTSLKQYLEKEDLTYISGESISIIEYENLDKEYQLFSNLPLYLKTFCIDIYKQFRKKITNEIKEYEKNNLTLLQIELNEQLKFLRVKSDIVLGRNSEIKSIINSSEQYYVIYGRSGSGKTSIMAKAIKELNSKNIIYRFVGTTAYSTSSRILFESIYWQLNCLLAGDFEYKLEKPEIEYDDEKFKKQFKKQLEKFEDKEITLFLDAIDQFEDKNRLDIILEDLPSNIKIVFSVLYDETKIENDDYSWYYNLLKDIPQTKVEPLDNNINEEVLNQWLKLSKRQIDKESNQWNILTNACKNKTPLYLKLAFEIVKQWKSTDNIVEESLPEKEEVLITKFFENTSNKHYIKKELLAEVLGLISASKDGLSESELIEIISYNKDILKLYERKGSDYPKLDKLPTSIFSKLYYHIQSFFTEKLIDNEMLIKPYHRIIEETLNQNYYKENLHKKLADYFYILQDKNLTWDKRYYNLHMLEEVPYQLLRSKDSTRLKEILFDLEFAGSIYNNSKQSSFKYIMSKAVSLDNITEDDIYPWESFYREKEHLIIKINEELWKPHQSLFQLSYEDGDNSPLTKEANLKLISEEISWSWSKPLWRNKFYYRTGLRQTIVLNDNYHDATYIDKNKVILYDYESISILNISNEISLKYYTNMCDISDVIKITSNLIMIWGDYIELVYLSSMEIISIEENETFLSYYIDEKEVINVLFCSGIIRKFDYLGNLIETNINYQTILKKVYETYKYDDLDQVYLLSNLIKTINSLNSKIVYKICSQMVEEEITWLICNSDGYVLLQDINLHITMYSNDNVEIVNCDQIWANKNDTILVSINDSLYEGDIESICNQSTNITIHENCEPSNFKKLARFLDGYTAMWNRDCNIIHISKYDVDRLELVGHKGNIQNLLEYGNKLLSWDDKGQILLWSWNDLEVSFEEVCISQGKIQNIYINGTSIITIKETLNSNINLQIWNLNTKKKSDVGFHTDSIKGLQYSNNNIFSWSIDGTLRVWDKNGNKVYIREGKDYIDTKVPIEGVIPWYNNEIITWSLADTGSIRKWNLDCSYDSKELTLNYNMRKYTSLVGDYIYNIFRLNIKNKYMIVTCYSKDNQISIHHEFGHCYNILQHSVRNTYLFDLDKIVLYGNKEFTVLSEVTDEYKIYHEQSFNQYIKDIKYCGNYIIHLEQSIIILNKEFEDICNINIKTEIIEVDDDKIYCIVGEFVQVYNLTGKLLYILEHGEPINEIKFISSTRRILTYSNFIIKVWAKTNIMKKFKNHKEPILGLIYCRNRAIISYSRTRLTIDWDKMGTLNNRTINLECELLGLIEIDNGNIAGWSENTIYIWDNMANLIKKISPRIGFADRLLEMQDGTYITDKDGKLVKWDKDGYFISKLEKLPKENKYTDLIIKNDDEIYQSQNTVLFRKGLAKETKDLIIPYK